MLEEVSECRSVMLGEGKCVCHSDLLGEVYKQMSLRPKVSEEQEVESNKPTCLLAGL